MTKQENKVALITGINGQDGSYLSEFLIKKKYIVHGVKRRSSSANTERIDHLFDSLNFSNKNFFMHYGDISDGTSTLNIINKTAKVMTAKNINKLKVKVLDINPDKLK